MRAWQVKRHGEPRAALDRSECAAPIPGPGFLRVRVAAGGLGLPDLLMCRGSYPLTPPLPFTPGQELAGEVSAVGEGCQALPGQRVMAVSGFFLGRGAFAEEALALDDFAFPVPDTMGDAEAASFVIPYHTAWVALVRRGALRARETLLVLGGAGGTGSAAIQLGAAIGARVIATARSPERAAFCRELGASEVIDPREPRWPEAVREATAGAGADVIYDPVGGPAFEAATRCIAHEGRLLLVGFASGRWGEPSAAHLAQQNYSVVGVIPSGYDRAFREEAQRALLELHGRGLIRVSVQQELPFDDLPEGLAALGRGEVLGKLVLMVGGPAAVRGAGRGARSA